MGIAVDPSRGTLYYANQGDGEEHGSSLSGIDLIDYAGGNHSTVVDLQSLELTPYGVEVSPEFIREDFNLDDPGILLITVIGPLRVHCFAFYVRSSCHPRF